MKCKRLLSLAISGAMLFGSVSLLPESAFSGNDVLTAQAMANYEYYIKFDTETETDRITLTSFREISGILLCRQSWATQVLLLSATVRLWMI